MLLFKLCTVLNYGLFSFRLRSRFLVHTRGLPALTRKLLRTRPRTSVRHQRFISAHARLIAVTRLMPARPLIDWNHCPVKLVRGKNMSRAKTKSTNDSNRCRSSFNPRDVSSGADVCHHVSKIVVHIADLAPRQGFSLNAFESSEDPARCDCAPLAWPFAENILSRVRVSHQSIERVGLELPNEARGIGGNPLT